MAGTRIKPSKATQKIIDSKSADGLDIVCGFDISGQQLRMEMFVKQADGTLQAVEKFGSDDYANPRRLVHTLRPGFESVTDSITAMVREGMKEMGRIRSIDVGLAVPARFEKPHTGAHKGYHTVMLTDDYPAEMRGRPVVGLTLPPELNPQYEDGSATVQQRLSGIHLGPDCWGKNWQEAVQEKLLKDFGEHAHLPEVKVKLMNDAGVQLLALVGSAKRHEADMDQWKNGKVLYVGPGSGFGASVAEIDHQGKVHVRHNAHMYDAMVKISPEQEAKIKELFTGDFTIVERNVDDFRQIKHEELQAFASYFPTTKDGKRQAYLFKDSNDDTYIIPSRYFASKDGIQHLLAATDTEMKDIGGKPKKAVTGEVRAKLDLLGELLGEYLVQLDRQSLKRLPFPGASALPYDRIGETQMPTKAILLGGGGLRDNIGQIIEDAARKLIRQKGSDALKKAEIHRPDIRQGTYDHNICETAAHRAVELGASRGKGVA